MATTSLLPRDGTLDSGVYSCNCENCGHFFKFRSVGDQKNDISLTINGQNYTVGNEFHPATSLLEFMRSTRISTGTKGGCYEGGCGLCLVTVTLTDPITGKIRPYAVNSCCLQLYTCDGITVTTVEGLGSTKDGLHPIQDRMAKHDGAQCGYCTPGQIMNMYGLLQKNPKPTVQEVEDAFDTTLCRCTGYRAILSAMKSFAVDAPDSLKSEGGLIDIEDLEGKVCRKTGQACVGHCEQKSEAGAPCGNSVPKSLHIVNASAQWFKPLTLSELYPLLRQHAADKYRLVLGNTGFGIYGEIGPWNYSVLIDIRNVQELYVIQTRSSDHITLGANVSIASLLELFVASTDPGLVYKDAFVKHLKRTASSGIRNLCSWAGNLMLKNLHKDFASDVFTMFETVGAKLNIGSSDGVVQQYTLLDFLKLDMKGKVIVSVELPKYSTGDRHVRTLKTSHRLQLCHAHVTCGFNFVVDANNNFLVKEKPSIVVQGINGNLIHAVQTEGYLLNRQLGDPNVLKGAIDHLTVEIVPDSAPVLASPTYRKNLALGHFYKFVLELCQSKCSPRYVSGGTDLNRPVMSGTQEYGTDDPKTYPVSKAMMKVTANNLTTGEIKFIPDLRPAQGQVYAAAVLATQGNAKIQSIDPSAALKMPGVLKFIEAKDIPGENNWRPRGAYTGFSQELLSSGQVYYAGQPIGIVVAEDEITAQSATFAVKVTYSDIQQPIVDLNDAIQKKSFFELLGPYTKGDAQAAMASAPHKVSGSSQSGQQYNFHMETQAAICTPTDTGGMDVIATSQWLDASLSSVAQVLGLPDSDVHVETQRLGGAFGGKIFYTLPVGAMCAVAAQLMDRPVKLHMDLHTNMQFQGKRTGYRYDYEIGFDDNGKILAIIAKSYSDTGALFFNQDGNEYTYFMLDGAYFCPNWLYTTQPCKTNKPCSTAVRAPGTAPAIYHRECMIDHVATYLKKDHLEVRKVNLFQDGQSTLAGMVIENSLISQMVSQMETDASYATRKLAVENFNKANRWKKRGLQMMPCRYGYQWSYMRFNTSVVVNHSDGSVVIVHGGIDMGQGINTKAIQTCAYKFGIPVDKIRVKTTNSVTNANSSWTAGSVSSELVCVGVSDCCDTILKRMEPVKADKPGATWEELVTESFARWVNLTASALPALRDQYVSRYNVWAVCCCEVELDVLTGHYQILQVDLLFDGGTSLNPELDMGQLEGGFVMGLGLFLLEDLTFDPSTGRLLNDGTWEYKIPLTKDLPIVFNSKFVRNAANPLGFLRSKAVGEAPVASGTVAVMALKRAVEAARAELGHQGWFLLTAPATVEKLQLACQTQEATYTFGQ
ncbi:xanthine dehydrogenase [Aplysia californica]|uniref:Xanthine dehydrogenase n=1 Tax=Aplysia californica TaxID=6500 RepID=A0ABM1VSH8_APLCA|nr:xanthine dehydrogenase [Aplysia californica]XP_035825370.1 xanthine dehydrogenase [Aplysia californica]